jgi:hypothetical protein
MKKSIGSQLAKQRWKKEKPDREFMSKIGKLGAKKRWEKQKQTEVKIEVDDNYYGAS